MNILFTINGLDFIVIGWIIMLLFTCKENIRENKKQQGQNGHISLYRLTNVQHV